MKNNIYTMKYLIIAIMLLCNCSGNERKVCATGIDLSHHNSGISWEDLEVDFVYLKATEGSTWTDPKFNEYMKCAKDNNIYVGAYHFFTCSSTGKKQFENFRKTVGENIDLVPVLDIEIRKKISRQQLQAELCAWIQECRKHYGCYPIIYTSDIFYIKNLKGNKTIGKCPVWLGDVDCKNMLTPHIMHQVTIRKIKGCHYPVDVNHLYVEINDIKRF